MATKFIRGIVFNSGSTTFRASYALKFMYELWGFCIYGDASTSTPGIGAFAATTPFGGGLPANFNGFGTTIAAGSNGASLPQGTINVISTTNFPTSGTILVFTNAGSQTVTYTNTTGTSFTGCTGGAGTMSTGNTVSTPSLLTFGSDGYTNATTIFRQDGYTDFFSASSSTFSSNMVGKQLVMWKAGSNSAEDSVYNIIAFKSPNNIVINVNTGGTPSSITDGYKPSVTTRSSINYRVVDIAAAGVATGVADGNFIIFQLDPTGINVGQANSQVQFIISGGTNLRLDGRISPGGTWNGTAFTDGTALITPTANSNSVNMTNISTSSQLIQFLFIGDKSFLIGQLEDNNISSQGSAFLHMEIPERLYNQTQDPNPVVLCLAGNSSPHFITTVTTFGYGGGMGMRCNDGIVRNYRLLSKASTGDGNATPNFNSLGSLSNIFGNALTDYRIALTPIYGSIMSSQAILCLPGVVGQYSLARVRLRTIRFTNSSMPLFTRFNSNGDFIQLTQGLALIWDKTVLPLTMFPF
jgi:hypothetical protein